MDFVVNLQPDKLDISLRVLGDGYGIKREK